MVHSSFIMIKTNIAGLLNGATPPMPLLGFSFVLAILFL